MGFFVAANGAKGRYWKMRKEVNSWIYDPKAECMSEDERAKVQSERLIKCVNRMWNNVPYYRKRMEEKGVEPGDIKSVADLPKLPLRINSTSEITIRSERWLYRDRNWSVYMLLPERPVR